MTVLRYRLGDFAALLLMLGFGTGLVFANQLTYIYCM
jgi:hypothetical protein